MSAEKSDPTPSPVDESSQENEESLGGCLRSLLIAALVGGILAAVGAVGFLGIAAWTIRDFHPQFDFKGLEVDPFAATRSTPDENARKLEWVAQSLREYQALHGRPPNELAALRGASKDLQDAYGHALEYRVTGSPPRWEIRSAGEDGRFDDRDPWVVGP